MAKYDFKCEPCAIVEERTCMIAERASQRCLGCGKVMTQLFTPTTNFYTPERFRHSFSEFFGTTSEKDYVQSMREQGREVTHINQSTFKTKRERDEAKWAKANRDAADIEKALMAQGKMKKPRAKKGDKPIVVAA